MEFNTQLMPGIEHRSHKGGNNRAENSHLAVRRREPGTTRFKSGLHLQRFVPIHDPIANLFHFPRRDLTSADLSNAPRGSDGRLVRCGRHSLPA